MKTSTQPTPSLAARIAGLPKLPMQELWSLWDQYFPNRPTHHHRAYVESRVAYKLQEEVFGGLKAEVRQQLIRIGAAQSKLSSKKTSNIAVVPGTVLIREHANREHRVVALTDGGFEYEGKRFRSLSAVARQITGTQWSGPVFFGLIKTERRGK